MDTATLATFRSQLQSRQTELLAQIAAQRGGDIGRAEAAAAHFGHPEDTPAQVNTERDTDFALSEHEVAHLNAIGQALQRIADGSYGQCTDCGITIPDARLHANPEAARCVACQEVAEHSGQDR